MSEIFSKILKDKNGKVLNVGSKYQQPEWGSETGIVEILPETTLEVMADIGATLIMTEVSLSVGKTYTVTYNGADYACTGIENPDGGVLLGNVGAMIEGAAVTNDPFMFMAIPADMRENYMGACAMVIPLDGSETFTFAIKGNGTVYNRIPSEYIGTYDQPKWGEEKDVVVLPETEVTSTPFDITTQFTLEVGKIYSVYWNGTKYSVTGRKVGDIAGVGNVDKYMATGDTGEPFIIITKADTSDGVYGVVIIVDGTTSATVSITEDVVHEIPGMYIEKTWFNEQITNVDKNARSYTDSSLIGIEIKLQPDSWDFLGNDTSDFKYLGFSSIDFANAPIDVVVENPNTDQMSEYEAILIAFGNHIGVPIIISYKYNGIQYNAIANAVFVNADNPYFPENGSSYKRCLKMNFFIDPSGKTNSISDTLYLAQISLGSTADAIEFHVRVRPMMFGNT